MHRRTKESPGRAGAKGPVKESSVLDAPIVSHGTNQARRGSRTGLCALNGCPKNADRCPKEASQQSFGFRTLLFEQETNERGIQARGKQL
jgi:hypothetical protein